MDNKKVIAFSLCGSLLVGATACADRQDRIDTTQANVTAQTESQNQNAVNQIETPDTTPTTETLSEPVELSESELHDLFEGVYLDSMASMRTNPVSNADLVIANEFNKLVEACPIGKELPTDYKVQYREWRTNYRVSDLSLLFTDVKQEMYVINSTYTYADIYGDGKMALMVSGEVIYVTGIGYDAAAGLLRVSGEYGEVYIKAEDVSAERAIEDQFTEVVNETWYAINEAVSYTKPQADTTHKSYSVKKGDTVTVIGIGYGDAEGWLKVDFGEDRFTGGIRYVRAEHFSDSKSSGGNQNNGSNGGSVNTGGQSGDTGGQGQSGSNNTGSSSENNGSVGSGGQQNGNSNSGGDQGSNNSGGNSSEGTYMDTGLTLKQIAELPDEEKIALGFTQRSDGSWADQYGIRLPSPELSEEDNRRAEESSEGVKWFG